MSSSGSQPKKRKKYPPPWRKPEDVELSEEIRDLQRDIAIHSTSAASVAPLAKDKQPGSIVPSPRKYQLQLPEMAADLQPVATNSQGISRAHGYGYWVWVLAVGDLALQDRMMNATLQYQVLLSLHVAVVAVVAVTVVTGVVVVESLVESLGVAAEHCLAVTPSPAARPLLLLGCQVLHLGLASVWRWWLMPVLVLPCLVTLSIDSCTHYQPPPPPTGPCHQQQQDTVNNDKLKDNNDSDNNNKAISTTTRRHERVRATPSPTRVTRRLGGWPPTATTTATAAAIDNSKTDNDNNDSDNGWRHHQDMLTTTTPQKGGATGDNRLAKVWSRLHWARPNDQPVAVVVAAKLGKNRTQPDFQTLPRLQEHSESKRGHPMASRTRRQRSTSTNKCAPWRKLEVPDLSAELHDLEHDAILR
ncbi:hypothetical protein EDB83DRAFT_2323423 [Lactarius deliciosus]|nr:hypothetical protein EDB83DRAFT_2323423 [Lactarius deliciosus]